MIVTAIQRTPRRRGRVDVYVDGVLACDLARDTARDRGLRPGRPIEQTEVDGLVAADRRRQALETAAAMLARRPRSEREIRRRLVQRKFAPELIEETVERLRAARLIDDAEFARFFAESRDRQSPRGRRLIVQELRASGVELTLAREAVEELSDADAAYRVASRRVRALSACDERQFASRLATQLQRRGFGWDVVRATIARCWREHCGEQADDDLELVID